MEALFSFERVYPIVSYAVREEADHCDSVSNWKDLMLGWSLESYIYFWLAPQPWYGSQEPYLSGEC